MKHALTMQLYYALSDVYMEYTKRDGMVSAKALEALKLVKEELAELSAHCVVMGTPFPQPQFRMMREITNIVCDTLRGGKRDEFIPAAKASAIARVLDLVHMDKECKLLQAMLDEEGDSGLSPMAHVVSLH